MAWWTIQRSTEYVEYMSGDELSGDPAGFLMQPHAAQVVAIFRLLGLDQSGSPVGGSVSNHMAQIKTGEGKSVVLGALSTVLALFGYRVDCACYSAYLSSRDYASFRDVFDAFGVTDFIRYGTFNELCEKVINGRGDVRNMVENLVRREPMAVHSRQGGVDRQCILLIDEVDVFFQPGFYGKRYRPLLLFRDPVVTNFLDKLWSLKGHKGHLRIAAITRLPEFKACVDAFPHAEGLVLEGTKGLVYDLLHFESHDYQIDQDRIAYKEHDGLSITATYGHKTLWAYYKETEAGRISQGSLNRSKGMYLSCGSFSYAEIPKLYSSILGVSGTIDCLSDTEKKILKKYKIKTFTFVPSVYGERKLQFAKDSPSDVVIADSDRHFQRLRKEIEDRLKTVTSVDYQRSVLSFQQTNPCYASTSPRK